MFSRLVTCSKKTPSELRAGEAVTRWRCPSANFEIVAEIPSPRPSMVTTAQEANPDAHAAAARVLASVPPEPQQIVCHLGPVVFDLAHMNPFHPAGLLFRFPLLDLDRPARGPVLRAFLDSVAYAVRGNREQIAAVGGPPSELRLSGGMTRVPALPGLVATVLGRPVLVASVPESASLGCAMLGAVAAGLHGGIADAVGAMAEARWVEPDTARTAAFDEGYARWRTAQQTLRGLTV